MRGRLLLASLAAVAALLLAGLGVWQVERRAWKLDLIARTEARVHAPAVPWAALGRSGEDDEYRRVRVSGRWSDTPPVLVKAVTALGSGWWVMGAIDTPAGKVLVNRGFASEQARGEVQPASGPATIEGLVRLTEPGGGFLRRNDPLAGRWFSRDVQAIARAQGWTPARPVFIDADARPGATWPRGGMTVLRFSNNHLIYALTWFALSGMAGLFAWRIARTGPAAQESAA